MSSSPALFLPAFQKSQVEQCEIVGERRREGSRRSFRSRPCRPIHLLLLVSFAYFGMVFRKFALLQS